MSTVEFSVVPPPPATIMAQAISAIERKAKDLYRAGLQARDVLAELTAIGHAPWTVDKLRCVARAEGVLEVEIPMWIADCQKFGWVPQASPSLAFVPYGGETSASSREDSADNRHEELARSAAYDYEPDIEADAPSVGSQSQGLGANGHGRRPGELAAPDGRAKAEGASDAPHDAESEAIQFLEQLRPGGPWVLTAIVPDGPTETITATTVEAVDAFVRRYDGKRNLYYRSTRRERR
jgi:hypothetical protein